MQKTGDGKLTKSILHRFAICPLVDRLWVYSIFFVFFKKLEDRVDREVSANDSFDKRRPELPAALKYKPIHWHGSGEAPLLWVL